jgi:uncharacterized membrane protein YbhN (UPF0104 family)
VRPLRRINSGLPLSATTALAALLFLGALPLTLVAAGAPFAGAVLAVLVYRLFNRWVPLLPAAAAVPRLRRRFGTFQALPRET